ncbi:chemotaxis protein CheX [Spirochaeta cellobiosiphila]|uniref:chemotaxis protein CheX n=1 Tax=Spirochaeta cellobiosiphila TaxID=504483 RepID=UPI00146E40F2|nr:chemotaxis protein CheX [Spirochaeta cellobiosiphila]
MNKLINKLLKQSLNNLFSEAGIDHKLRSFQLFTKPVYNLVCTIGVTGDHHGFLYLYLSVEDAKKLVIMFSEAFNVPVESGDGFTDFHKGTLGEIINQLSGQWCTLLSKHNIDCNISPPTIIKGSDVSINTSGNKAFKPIYIKGDFGTARIQVNLKN